ncbi:DUF6597 domain-containing transcriptional factor [Rhodococcus pyridinivorans]|uniref:DUF6597 domain-containing transcriptional factor n=1 Tax=Rhodococcus pyridinivorans TaxID=103816 RepID=UPI0002E2FC6A|nr:DUF6597 domain-containing transcriptional factor [Rhodococcus pyridinivorans]MCD2142893.1 hypothetical protein [Rhodococcus pyridinivorans]
MYRELPSGILGVTLWRSGPSGARVGGTHVLPDGYMDLIRHADGFLVAGPDTTSQFSDLMADRPLTAVRFEPGLGPRFFGVDASELTDRRVPLDDLWPSRRVRLLAVRAEDDPVAALVDAVRGAVDEHDPMADLARALAAGTAVTEVAATLGWSDRTLRRRSARAYGYGPKTLSRVLRFRRDRSRSRSAVPRTRPRVSSSKCTGLDQHCKCRVDRFGGTAVEGECRCASGRRLELRIEAADGLDGVPHQAQTTGESDLEVRYLGCFGGQVEAEHVRPS